MKINCLDFNLTLIEVINFTFGDEGFKITIDNSDEYYNIDDKVKYLEITYSLLEDLSLLHLFLVQHRQETLRLGKVKIIIIEDFQPSNEEKCILYNYQHEVQDDQYWLNIASLSVQIGFKVKSISLKDEQVYKETQNEIIVVSTKFPDFDIYELDNHFTDFIGETKKDIPVKQLFEKLSFPIGVDIKNFENSFLVLIQHISMKIHQIQDYSHFLPMTLAYNAFRINKKISEYVNQETINNVLSQCQEIYLTHKLTKEQIINAQQTNYFKLPLHLLKSFTFTELNKCIFQQMCDISYLFKAEFFCIYQQYNDLKNAVISQSSRSGKSVSILSVYYFNILTKQKIPVYINLAYNTNQETGNIQPLYYQTSIKMKSSMSLIHDYFYQPDIDETIQLWIQNVIAQSLDYQEYFEQIYNLIRQSFNLFDSVISHDKLLQIFNNIQKASFINFIENYTSLINQIYPDLTPNNVQTDNVQDSPQIQKEDLNIKNPILDNIENNDRQIIILVDEVLQQQKEKFNKCSLKVKLLTKHFSKLIIEKAIGSLKTILLQDNFINQNYHTIAEGIMARLDIEYDKEKMSEYKLQNIQNIILKVNEIYKNNEEDKYFFKFFSFQFFLKGAKIDEIINFICITSPNFLNLRSSLMSIKIFSEHCNDLNTFGNKNVFEQCLFKFIMQLYNPRGIETIFWRNMYFSVTTTANYDHSHNKSFHSDLQIYFKNDQQQLETFFKQIPTTCYANIAKQYHQHQIFSHQKVHLLTSGTDLALINFVSQHELLYTSASSRSINTQYIQSHIFSGVQLHSSLLGQDYYQNSTISMAKWDKLKYQVDDRLKKQDILQFYQLIVPELASEVQLVCPLISPQIIISESKLKNLVTNSVHAFQYNVNQNSYDLKIIDSYTQILNSLQIIRQNNEICLQSSQLNKNGKQVIYANIKETKNFSNNLFISTSMQFNSDVVFYFFYKASQYFQLYIKEQKTQDSIQEQAEITRLSLKYSTVSEITAPLIFITFITQIQIKYFKEFLVQYQMKNLYLEQIQIIRNTKKTVETSEYVHPKQAILDLKKYFEQAEFMFLQPCLDFIASTWGLDSQQRMDKLMNHLYITIATCYQRLIQLECIKPLDENVNKPHSYKPFIIAVPIDKNKLYNKLQVCGSVADFLVAFFPGNKEAIKDLDKQGQFFKQHSINNSGIKFYTCIVESGIHIKEVLAKKADINHNSIFQVTPYIGQNNLENFNIEDIRSEFIQLFSGVKMDQKLGFDQQKEELKDFLGDMKKEDNINQLKQWHQKNKDLKFYYIQFNREFLKIYEQYFEQFMLDITYNEYCIYLQTNLEDYLANVKLEFNYISLQQSFELNEIQIYELAININKFIYIWSSKQKSIAENSSQNIQTLLNSYQNINKDISQYKISGSTLTMNIGQSLSQFHNKIIAGGTVNVVNNNEIQLSSQQITLSQLIQFINRNNLIILGFEGLLTNLYQVKDCPYFEHKDIDQIMVEDQVKTKKMQILHWFNKKKLKDTAPDIENYFNLFKLIEFDDKIATSADLSLFQKKFTIKKQVDQIFKVAKKAEQIRIKFFNENTQQIEKQKGINIEIAIQSQEYYFDKVLKLLGRRVIFSSGYKDNIVILKVVKAFICYYCEATDKSRLVTCQDCDEHLCQEHVQSHSVEFEHFQYKRHDNSVFHLSQTNSVVEAEPVQKNTKAINLSPLQTIKQWLASYPPQRSAEVENYLKLFVNLREENVKNANLELFANGMTVEEQIEHIIDKANKIIQNGKINILYADGYYPNYICLPGEILTLLDTKVVINFEVPGSNVLILNCPE